jgi:DNA replication protein DnaC
METRTCLKHGDYQDELKPNLSGTGIGYTGCPQCNADYEAMIKADDESRKLREERQEHEVLISRYRAMNIKPMYFDSTFDNFHANTPELEINLDLMRSFVFGKIKKIIMVGKNGTGKTHLACASVKIMGGAIYTIYEIGIRIHESYTSLAKETERQIIDELSRLPLFAIDEMGRSKGSKAEEDFLSQIIDNRHASYLPLIMITNKHLIANCNKHGCPDCLENYLSENMISRLTQDGIILNFSGEDWRRK